MMPTWLLIVPLLAFLVFVHELGHFVAAKRFGIKVLEFGFGFPPRLFGVRHGETVYSINAIPLGGFVRLLGEEDPTDERSLARQSVLRRVIVLCAGSFMNFAVAFVIFAALSMLPRDVVIGTVTVTGVAPDSPAAHAGIRAGDQVLAVNGEQVRNPRELIREVTINLGYETELSLRRGSIVTGLPQSMETAAVETVTVVPRLNPPSMEVVEVVTDRRSQVSLREARRYRAELAVGDTLRQGAIGIILGVTNGRVVQERLSPWRSAPHALGRMWEVLVVQKNGIQQMFAGGGGGPAADGSHRNRAGHGGGGAVWREDVHGADGAHQHQPGHSEHTAHSRAGRRAADVRTDRVGAQGQANLAAQGGSGASGGVRRADRADSDYKLLRRGAYLVWREFYKISSGQSRRAETASARRPNLGRCRHVRPAEMRGGRVDHRASYRILSRRPSP